MSLLQLLSLGQSVKSLQREANPYKLAPNNYFPKFGPLAQPLIKARISEPVPIPADTQFADSLFACSPAMAKAAHTPPPSTREPLHEKVPPPLPSKPPVETKNSAPASVGRWSLSRPPSFSSSKKTATHPAVQAEFSLDRIRVVRNDLNQTDLELISLPVKHQPPGVVVKDPLVREAKSPLLEWSRMVAKIFTAGKTA